MISWSSNGPLIAWQKERRGFKSLRYLENYVRSGITYTYVMAGILATKIASGDSFYFILIQNTKFYAALDI
jgi:hypothetical protein